MYKGKKIFKLHKQKGTSINSVAIDQYDDILMAINDSLIYITQQRSVEGFTYRSCTLIMIEVELITVNNTTLTPMILESSLRLT